MRVFVALDIDDSIRARLEKFLDGVRGFAPEARWVRPESMHVTLKFIGEKPAETVEEIKQALSGIRAGAIRDFISRIRIFSYCQIGSRFLDRHCGWPATRHSCEVGG